MLPRSLRISVSGIQFIGFWKVVQIISESGGQQDVSNEEPLNYTN